jgi:hypothetical protein
VFDAEPFQRASDDRFFLALRLGAGAAKERARAALEALHPLSVSEVLESRVP